MDITSARYFPSEETSTSILATIDGLEMYVPLDLANRHYAEIMRQVNAGDLEIQDSQ